MNRSSLQAVAWTLVVALTAFGCSNGGGEADPCAAFLRFNLEVGGGAVIDEVSYTISGDDMSDMGGTINTSAPGSTASVETFGIPEGGPYLIEMTATSVDGTLMCGGNAEFNVEAGVRTEVDVMLNCKVTQSFGGVRVNGELNICTELDKVIVAPLQTATGYALEVQAEASDAEGDKFGYRWSATGGSFDDADAAETVFTCGEADIEKITIEVSDDDFHYCKDFWTVDISCEPDDGAGGSGGNGGSAGSGGTVGTGGTAGSGGGGGTAGTAGVGGSGGSAGNGGTDGGAGSTGSGGRAGSGGTIPPECLVSLSVR